MNRVIHVCSFEAVELPRPLRRLTYEAFKEAVLKAGRFSIFEATERREVARLYDRLARDPSVKVTPMQFPWTKVEVNL